MLEQLKLLSLHAKCREPCKLARQFQLEEVNFFVLKQLHLMEYVCIRQFHPLEIQVPNLLQLNVNIQLLPILQILKLE